MQIVQARIDGQAFSLESGADLGDTKRRILEAVLRGAGFVDIDVRGGRRLSVLVTPAIPVRFEVFEVDDDRAAPVGPRQTSSPFDQFDQFELFDYADSWA